MNNAKDINRDLYKVDYRNNKLGSSPIEELIVKTMNTINRKEEEEK